MKTIQHRQECLGRRCNGAGEKVLVGRTALYPDYRSLMMICSRLSKIYLLQPMSNLQFYRLSHIILIEAIELGEILNKSHLTQFFPKQTGDTQNILFVFVLNAVAYSAHVVYYTTMFCHQSISTPFSNLSREIHTRQRGENIEKLD